MQSPAEARAALAAGADALGLVSRMPSGPGPISDAMIAEIVATIPAGVPTFLLTSRTTAPEIVTQQGQCGANTLQLVDKVTPEARRMLRAALPNVSIVQVVHVRDESAIAEAIDVSSEADAILLDSGNPALAVKELGGTGRAHDWEISRAVRESVTVPVWLAGGLTALNVASAIAQVSPFGVDVCSGVRTAGNLDESKLAAFVKAVRTRVAAQA